MEDGSGGVGVLDGVGIVGGCAILGVLWGRGSLEDRQAGQSTISEFFVGACQWDEEGGDHCVCVCVCMCVCMCVCVCECVCVCVNITVNQPNIQ